MKNLLFVLMLTPMVALTAAPDFSAITRALNSGDVATLAKYMDNTVEVGILGEEGVYRKVQAAQILKQFFVEHAPKSFSLVHQGTNNKSLHYCIGKMECGADKFRVTYYIKEVNGEFLIQEIGIEKG
ncbi:MAG: DUF4783 domain-containing protein [Bacteroidota bacterium]